MCFSLAWYIKQVMLFNEAEYFMQRNKYSNFLNYLNALLHVTKLKSFITVPLIICNTFFFKLYKTA